MKYLKILIIKPYAYLWISIALAIFGIFLSCSVIFNTTPLHKSEVFQKELEKRNTFLQQITFQFIQASFSKSGFSEVRITGQQSDWEKKEILFLVYQSDSLFYWSGNNIPFPLQSDSGWVGNRIKKLSNGWYLQYSKLLPGNVSITAFALIKHNYPYENDYLKNDYYSTFSASPGDSISLTPPGYPVKDSSGSVLLYYKPSAESQLQEDLVLPILLVFIFSFLLFFLFLYYLFGKISIYKDRPFLLFTALLADIVLFRMLGFWFRFPGFLYHSTLFSPSYFAASSWLPSLGDLFSNTAILFFIALLFFNLSWPLRIRALNNINRWVLAAFCYVFVIFYYVVYVNVFDVIISNSSFSITLSDPSAFSLASVLTFIIIALLTGCYFMLSLPLLKILFKLTGDKTQLAGLTLAVILQLLIFHFQKLPVKVPLLVFVLYVLWLYLILKKKKNPFSLSSLLLQVVIFSFLSTFMILTLNETRELDQRKLIAQKLASERDPLAEYLVEEAYSSMQKDIRLRELLKHYPEKDSNEQLAIQYILDHYFNNYWSKYNLEITLCTPDRILNVVIPDNALINCKTYFSELIKNVGKATLSKNLHFLDYGSGSLNYLAGLPFLITLSDKPVEVMVYIDISSKKIPKGLGYPELLISKESGFNPDMNYYSYAIYNKNELQRSFGKYSYPLRSAQFLATTGKFSAFSLNNSHHLAYAADKDKVVVVSLKNSTVLDNIAPFSYFALLISITAFISLLLLSPPGSLFMKNQSFRNRLQLSMILLILFSFIIIGVTSAYYITRLNYSKNIDALTEKAHSILTEIQQKLGKSEALVPEMSNELFYSLNKLSLIYFSDINLFDLKGNLIASSRPSIFEEGLISTKMNRQSYQELSINQRSLYIHDDKIGNYKFLSAYLPFRNEQDQLIGYLNLPYFARQDEIRSELSAFLVTFINIYVLLVAFSILMAIVISRYITKPLLLIRDKISQVRLGKPNEKIIWRVDDEIGGLVAEYNTMIDKLLLSAEQLAQSERESAWREMARQVAHEIKNPLTPMKLSVQLLQKAYNEKEPDWDQRFKRFSRTLIEQIENLSHIAGSFSDFARMPELHKEQINLYEICNSVIQLYRDNHDVTIITEFPENIQPLISADSNQLMRVFVNLFKNSLQAFVQGIPGKITLKMNESEGFFVVAFSDNGTGIDEDQQSKIFSPNFTTKTGGMGLGLAMVKSIMEDHGGSVSFVSESGKGTTFFLKFPMVKQ
jgi:two-component system nitrogen regulation sensor histidine kinase NtrY